MYTSDEFATAVQRFEAAAQRHPQVIASFRPGAHEGALRVLSERMPKGRDLPPDLAAWFAWHDGQREGSQLFSSMPFWMLSIADAIDALDFFSHGAADVEHKWKSSWIPLFANGSGDYIAYETAGKRAGALIHYWHDEAAEPAFASLMHLLTTADDELELAEVESPTTAPSATLDEAPARNSTSRATAELDFESQIALKSKLAEGTLAPGEPWVACERPTAEECLAAAPGTLVRLRRTESGKKGEWLFWKIAPNCWVNATPMQSATPAAAFKALLWVLREKSMGGVRDDAAAERMTPKWDPEVKVEFFRSMMPTKTA